MWGNITEIKAIAGKYSSSINLKKFSEEHTMWTLLLILVAFLVESDWCQNEILQNPGFEEPFDGDDWYCVGCDVTQDTDAYSGTYSGKVSNRQKFWASINQDVVLQPDSYYYFSVYVKLMFQNPGALWHQADILVAIKYTSGDTDYQSIASLPHLSVALGWQKLAGDFYVENNAVESVRAYILVGAYDEKPMDYLVDETSLTAFPFNPNWKDEANARIEQIRKNDVTMNVNIKGPYDPANIQVKVNQISSSYPFGSAIVDGQITGDSEYNKRYQDIFYSNFNWAVHENAMKWYAMEPQRDQVRYPDQSMRILTEKGIPVRGHCVFWGVDRFVPYWLKTLSLQEVATEIEQRLNYTVPRYAGQLVHWDVNNEQEHGTWFEETLNNPTIMNDFFSEVQARDTNALLFLNDYQIINRAKYTQAIVNKANEIHAATGIDVGIGVQGHFTEYPDVTSVQKRLDVLDSSGYSVFVTELDIEIEDREQRADAYDDMTTLLYSNPAIDGIMLWGFSDLHHWRPNCSLFEGEFFEPNAAGLRWQEMIFQRWRTYETFNPQSSSESFGFRGFHGSYRIQVTNIGKEIQCQVFEIPVGQDVTVNVDIN